MLPARVPELPVGASSRMIKQSYCFPSKFPVSSCPLRDPAFLSSASLFHSSELSFKKKHTVLIIISTNRVWLFLLIYLVFIHWVSWDGPRMLVCPF